MTHPALAKLSATTTEPRAAYLTHSPELTANVAPSEMPRQSKLTESHAEDSIDESYGSDPNAIDAIEGSEDGILSIIGPMGRPICLTPELCARDYIHRYAVCPRHRDVCRMTTPSQSTHNGSSAILSEADIEVARNTSSQAGKMGAFPIYAGSFVLTGSSLDTSANVDDSSRKPVWLVERVFKHNARKQQVEQRHRDKVDKHSLSFRQVYPEWQPKEMSPAQWREHIDRICDEAILSIEARHTAERAMREAAMKAKLLKDREIERWLKGCRASGSEPGICEQPADEPDDLWAGTGSVGSKLHSWVKRASHGLRKFVDRLSTEHYAT